MDYSTERNDFMARIQKDGRIGPLHVSLYMAILYQGANHQYENPVRVKAREIMPLAKIVGIKAYHRCMRELHSYGYFRYEVSFDPAVPSMVYLW